MTEDIKKLKTNQDHVEKPQSEPSKKKETPRMCVYPQNPGESKPNSHSRS